VALRTADRFLDPHLAVTAHALDMISANQTGSIRFFRVERLPVAAAALGRFFGLRAVVMTALAKRSRIRMEIGRQLVVADSLYQRLNDFAVGHFNRLVFIRQLVDHNLFRNVFDGKGAHDGRPGVQQHGRQHGFFRFARDFRARRRPFHMAGPARRRIPFEPLLDKGMATGAGFIGLGFGMTPEAGGVGTQLVHGLLQLDEIALFDPVDRVAFRTRRQAGMMANPTGIVVYFMGLVIERNGFGAQCAFGGQPGLCTGFDKNHVRLVALHARHVFQRGNFQLLLRIVASGTIDRPGLFFLGQGFPMAGDAGLVCGFTEGNALVLKLLLVAIAARTFLAFDVNQFLGLLVKLMMAIAAFFILRFDVPVMQGFVHADRFPGRF